MRRTREAKKAEDSQRILAPAVLITTRTLVGGPSFAQRTTGEPGSPSATTTIDGRQLPAPPRKFGGAIGETATKSKPYWLPRIVPLKGAPNVLLIITDDSGYGVPGTFDRVRISHEESA